MKTVLLCPSLLQSACPMALDWKPAISSRTILKSCYPPELPPANTVLLMPLCFAAHKRKACKENLPTPIQKQTTIIPRNHSFCFPVILPITIRMTRRWGRKREQQMFPKLSGQAVWKMFHIWEGNHSCMNCSSYLIPAPTENWRGAQRLRQFCLFLLKAPVLATKQWAEAEMYRFLLSLPLSPLPHPQFKLETTQMLFLGLQI